MLFYYIYKMTWAYYLKKTVLPFKSSFFKFYVSYHVKTINNEKTQALKKSHEVKVPLFEVISTYVLRYILNKPGRGSEW